MADKGVQYRWTFWPGNRWMVALQVAMVALASAATVYSWTSGGDLFNRLVWPGLAVLMLFNLATLPLERQMVVGSEDGLTVTTGRRTTRVRRDDIREIRRGAGGGEVLHLRDATEVGLPAFFPVDRLQSWRQSLSTSA